MPTPASNILDLGLLLAQLVVVLMATRLAGAVMRPLGQPQVVGEMLAGLALGPSLLGAVAPRVLAALFPADRLVPLAVLSQLGVLLFMFVVGLRLDLDVLRGRARAAVAVSHASIVAPFLLGIALAPLLHPALAPPGVRMLPFTLFLGAAMSVTAFPVLARILSERGLLHTRVGAIAIASAAIDDVTAWCILGAVVAVAQAPGAAGSRGIASFLGMITTTTAYVLLLLLLVRPALGRWVESQQARIVSGQIVGLATAGALASAWVTEHIGVHALLGSFVAGVVVPRSRTRGPASEPGPVPLASAIADRIEPVVGAVLLPVFFAFTGLRTVVGLVDGRATWVLTCLVLLAAVVGKVGGAAGAARLFGMQWRDALAVGLLMNTRGLMELIILNVGLDIGVISPTLFAMMVLMALVTTMMSAPLLGLLRRNAVADGRMSAEATRPSRSPPAA